MQTPALTTDRLRILFLYKNIAMQNRCGVEVHTSVPNFIPIKLLTLNNTSLKIVPILQIKNGQHGRLELGRLPHFTKGGIMYHIIRFRKNFERALKFLGLVLKLIYWLWRLFREFKD